MTPLSRFIRPQDLVWLLLFGALHLVSPVRNNAELQLLAALAVFQVLCPKIDWFSKGIGLVVSILAKLLLGWLLMGVTYGVESSYYLILLLPVVAAATSLSAWGATAVAVLTAGAYLSFLLFLDWNIYVIPPDQAREISLRVLFFPLVAYLTYQLAEENRAEAKKYQEAAQELAKANRSLHEAEAAVRRADRLAALGQLTAGLAHELRNPLGTIKNSAELLNRRLDRADEISRELTGFISTEVDRTNILITRFLDFARPVKLKLTPADVAAVVDRAVEEIGRSHPHLPVTIFKNYSPDVRPVPADPELLERVVLNLITNAAQASPPGGVVTVRTRQGDSAVEIAVIDRGSGIDPKQRESIFNPFFTTKPDGVGLGLAIVSKIVDEHGGKIVVESTPGEGSIFRVWLPNAES